MSYSKMDGAREVRVSSTDENAVITNEVMFIVLMSLLLAPVRCNTIEHFFYLLILCANPA